MKGDGLNFDQSDVDNDEEFEKIRKDLAYDSKNTISLLFFFFFLYQMFICFVIITNTEGGRK